MECVPRCRLHRIRSSRRFLHTHTPNPGIPSVLPCRLFSAQWARCRHLRQGCQRLVSGWWRLWLRSCEKRRIRFRFVRRYREREMARSEGREKKGRRRTQPHRGLVGPSLPHRMQRRRLGPCRGCRISRRRDSLCGEAVSDL